MRLAVEVSKRFYVTVDADKWREYDIDALMTDMSDDVRSVVGDGRITNYWIET